jgi:uncharacterized protein
MRLPLTGLTALALSAASAATAHAQSPTPTAPPTVTTSATAEASVAPDRATILVAVETHGNTAATAGAENAKLTRAVLDTLRALGLTKDQTGTLGYRVTPQYTTDKGKSRVTGYDAANTVKVELKVVADVGRMVDAALAAGANNISSLQFTATNADSARRDALARATVQARGDAEAMAKALGASLGPPVEVTTDSQGGIRFGPAPMMARMAVQDNAPTPIDAGPITINVTVHGRWQLVSGR